MSREPSPPNEMREEETPATAPNPPPPCPPPAPYENRSSHQITTLKSRHLSAAQVSTSPPKTPTTSTTSIYPRRVRCYE